MKLNRIALSLIALGASIAAAHAQILSATLQETVTLADNSVESNVGPTVGVLTLNVGGSTGVGVTLSASGLIMVTDNFTSSTVKEVDITISSINFAPGDGPVTGISNPTGAAFSTPGGVSLNNDSTAVPPNGATIMVTSGPPGSGSAGELILATGASSTYQLALTVVPEPHEWALIVLLGLGGIVTYRKISNRYGFAA